MSQQRGGRELMFSGEKPIEAAMYDDDRDALAAEYVLGTLSAEERDQAEALLAKDAGFAETVRLWEHRLGELNVMVEAVEPPPDLWERIKTGIDRAEPQNQATSEAAEPTEMQPESTDGASRSAGSQIDAIAEPTFYTVPDLLSDPGQSSEGSETIGSETIGSETTGSETTGSNTADLASALLPAASAAESDDRLLRSTTSQTATGTKITTPDQNVGRWRGLGIGASVIAVLLAAYIALSQFAPRLIPLGRQPQATASAPKPAAVPRLVAVLQQEPMSPAFLVMLDPQQRTITVRRLTAAPDTGRSYELWLNSDKLPKPASLGPVGNGEVTTRSIPQNIDVETMRSATYSVSLEPAGSGSAMDAPTGPMLFKGRMIDATPGS